MFFFTEISHQVTSLPVIEGQDVKQERFHVIVKCFVIKKQLDQKTEILTVDLVCVSVNFKD